MIIEGAATYVDDFDLDEPLSLPEPPAEWPQWLKDITWRRDYISVCEDIPEDSPETIAYMWDHLFRIAEWWRAKEPELDRMLKGLDEIGKGYGLYAKLLLPPVHPDDDVQFATTVGEGQDGRPRIVIKERLGQSMVAERIAALVRSGKVTDITALIDDEEIGLVIDLVRGADPQVVLNQLRALADLPV